MRSICSLSDYNNHPSISKITYYADEPTLTTQATISDNSQYSQSFMIGLDLENYGGPVVKDGLFTAMNLKNDDTQLILHFGTPTNAIASVQLNCMAHIDCELIFENGTVYTIS